MHDETLAGIAPGRLSALVTEGLRGHHPLFDRDDIVAAFAEPDAPVAREDASAVGLALLAICRDPPAVARGVVRALPDSAHVALVRLYFRLLDHAQEQQPLRH